MTGEHDRIFVSRPVLGRVSNKWSLQLTRPFFKLDGSFGGVIVASINPERFAETFSAIDLGAGGSVTLLGLDGIVRASGGVKPAALGGRIAEAAINDSVANTLENTILFRDPTTSRARIASTRRMAGYPLAIVVSTDEQQPGNSAERNRRVYIGAANLISLLILSAIYLIMRRSQRLSEARVALQTKSDQLSVTLENIMQGILMVEPDGKIGFMNTRLAELLSIPESILPSIQRYSDLVEYLERNGDFQSPIGAETLAYIRRPDLNSLIPQYERQRPDGTILEVRTKVIPNGGFVRTLTDITGRRSAERRVLQLARNDTLTGLANRAVFRHQLEQAIETLPSNPAFALHMIDLDRFKPVNDTYGHATGDLLLKAVADRLRNCVRSTDVVGRLGGDEFAVIQRDVLNESQSAALAKRICKVLSEPFSIDGHVIMIGASVGVAHAPSQGNTAQDLLNAADLALYSAKAAARGTYAFYNETMHDEQCARRKLEEDLRQAIETEAFDLHYQPIVATKTGEVSAYEALLRWNHPVRGNVAPLDFIPLAEETGLIRAIGAWVMRQACKEMGRREGTARVAVNLSPVQFRDPGLVDTVRAALDQSGLASNRLEIEITESALLQNDKLTIEHLDALRKLGVHITMDDFGTGYSALSYLMTYPIQTIKIDRTFVSGIGTQTSSIAIIRTIATLASNLGLSTTAEGVETTEQLSMLRDLGCTDAQGYLFSKPRPAAEILPPELPQSSSSLVSRPSPDLREAS